MYILQAVFLAAALSLDAFVAAFSFGVNKVKIPLISAFLITLICTAVLAGALFLGALFSTVINPNTAKIISCIILIVVGLVKLSDSLIKSYIKRQQKKQKNIDKKINFKFFSLQFMINIYADPVEADQDSSKILSVKEAIGLAIVLSLDSLSVGIGAGLLQGSFAALIAISFVAGFIFVILGALFGKLLAKKSKINLSWLSGTILILLGIARFFV